MGLKIEILYSTKNVVYIADLNDIIWLYSFGRAIAHYNDDKFYKIDYDTWTRTDKNHFAIFEKFLLTK